MLAVVFSGGGVSKEEFIQQADAICSQVSEDASEIEPSPDIGEYYGAFLPLLERQTTEIRALEAPDEDAETLEAWLETQDRLAESFSALAEGTADSDEVTTEITEIQVESSELATQYGFETCGIITTS